MFLHRALSSKERHDLVQPRPSQSLLMPTWSSTVLLPICTHPQEALWSVDREINISVCFFI